MGIKLSKGVKGLYLKNYKTLVKLTQTDEKIYHAHVLEKLILLKDHNTDSNLLIQCKPYQNNNGTCPRSSANNLKFVWKPKRPYNSKNKTK